MNSTSPPDFSGASNTSGTEKPTEYNTNPNAVPIARGARPWRSSRHFSSSSDKQLDQASLAADKMLIRRSVAVSVSILTVIWGVFFIDEQLGLALRRFGNRPLQLDGLIGVLSMPFLHGDFKHLWGNSVSFFSLNSLLIYFYRNLGFKVLGWSWIATGCLLWLSGASGNHIGLSGVIYALSAFLFFSGLIRQSPRLIRVSMVVVFLYGSIVWGVFPIEVGVSWQGHLSGALVGTFLALAWHRQGPQKPAPMPYDDDSDNGISLAKSEEEEAQSSLNA